MEKQGYQTIHDTIKLNAGMDRRLLKWDAVTGKPLGSVPLKLSRNVVFSRPGFNLSRDGTRGLRRFLRSGP